MCTDLRWSCSGRTWFAVFRKCHERRESGSETFHDQSFRYRRIHSSILTAHETTTLLWFRGSGTLHDVLFIVDNFPLLHVCPVSFSKGRGQWANHETSSTHVSLSVCELVLTVFGFAILDSATTLRQCPLPKNWFSSSRLHRIQISHLYLNPWWEKRLVIFALEILYSIVDVVDKMCGLVECA